MSEEATAPDTTINTATPEATTAPEQPADAPDPEVGSILSQPDHSKRYGGTERSYDPSLAEQLLSFGEDSEGESDEQVGDEPTSSDEGKEEKKSEEPERSAEPVGEDEPEDKSEDKDDGSTDKGGSDVSVVKFKSGDKEVELAEDAKIAITVDGKEQEVTVSELTRNYQGKIPWNEQYNKLKTAEAEFEAEKATWYKDSQQQQSAMVDLAEMAQKDPWGALVKIAISQKQDPTEFLGQYLAQAKDTIEHVATLSEEDVKLLIREKSLEYKEEMQQQDNKKQEEVKTTHAENRKFFDYLTNKQQELKITDDESAAVFKQLKQFSEDPNHPFTFKGMDRYQQADQVFKYITQFDRPITRIEGVLKDIDPKLVNDKQLVLDIKKTLLDNYPETTDAEIREVVLGVIGKPSPSATQNGSAPKAEADSAKPSTESPKQQAGATSGNSHEGVAEAEEDDAEDYNPMDIRDIVNRYN